MNNKKRNILFILLIVIAFVSVFTGIAIAQGANITVDGDISPTYARGTKLSIPEAKLTLGSNEYDMSSTVVFPDGRCTTEDGVVLDVAGEYILTYSVEVEGTPYSKEYGFTAEDRFESLFTYGDNVYCEGEMEIPSYINRENYIGRVEGVKYTFTENNATIKYDGIIDLAKIGFDSSHRTGEHQVAKPFEFIEFLITPEDNSTKEFNYLELKLTDIYDENNFIRIDMTAADKTMKYPNTAYTGVVACDRYDSIGYDNTNLSTTGANVGTSFYGQVGQEPSSSCRFYFDNDDLNTYVFPHTPEYRVTDKLFDKIKDTNTVGLGNEWFGFTTGEVYLEITVGDMASKKCSIMVLSVGAHNLDAFASGDSVISVVTGDLDGDGDIYDADTLPYALAGANNSYPVFDTIAYNPVGGVLSGVSTKVYYGESRENIAIANGRFKTEKTGTYYIEYSLLGSAYGDAKKIVEVEAKSAYDYGDAPDYILNSQLVSSAGIGDKVAILKGATVGGSGAWSEKIQVSCKPSYSEEWEDIAVLGTETQFFVAEDPGEYKIDFISTDLVGTVVTKTHTVTVENDTAPRMKDAPIPTFAVKNYSIVFPHVEAQYVSSEGKKDVSLEIFVDGVDYTNKPYTVKGDFTVVYRASVVGDATKFIEKSYSVSAVDLTDIPDDADEELFVSLLSSYFKSSESVEGTPDVTTSIANGKNIQFTTSVDGAGVTLTERVPFEKFDITLSPVSGSTAYSAVKLILTDFEDISETVELTLTRTSANKLLVALNGEDCPLTQDKKNEQGETVPELKEVDFAKIKVYVEKWFEDIDPSDTATNFVARYRFVLTTGAYEFRFEIGSYNSGVEFAGFGSKSVFAGLEFVGVTAESKINVEKICNAQYKPENFISDVYINKFLDISDVNGDDVADFETLMTADNMILSTKVDGASFSFIRDIPIELFSVTLEVSSNKFDNRFNAINVYLTDSKNIEEQVKLSIVKIEKNGIVYSQFWLNGSPVKAISGSFDGSSNTPFALSYKKSEKAIYDSLGIKLGEIESFIDGSEFNGFSSGYVYMTVELEGVTGQTAVKLKKISNQSINSNITEDKVDPQLMYSTNTSRRVYAELGKSVTVYSAVGYDVLSEIKKLSVLIESPAKTSIYSGNIDNDYTFTPNSLGQYKITYTVEDTKNNIYKSIFYAYVQEENAPTLTVSGEPKSTYLVGEKLKVGAFTVTDDSDDNCVVTVFIQTPTMRQNNLKVGDEITFEETGYYVLKYYARDKYYNATTVSFGILVVEGEEA